MIHPSITEYTPELRTHLNQYPLIKVLVEAAAPFYMQEHRRYHDFNHYHQILNAALHLGVLEELSAQSLNQLLVAAAWHDAVYTPGSSVNEQASADLLRFIAPTCFTDPQDFKTVNGLVYEASHIIGETTLEHHRTGWRQANLPALLCDADLAGLCSDYNMFVYRQQRVLEESRRPPYRSHLMACGILLSGLKKSWTGTVYNTKHAARLWGEQTNKNIEMLCAGALLPA